MISLEPTLTVKIMSERLNRTQNSIRYQLTSLTKQGIINTKELQSKGNRQFYKLI